MKNVVIGLMLLACLWFALWIIFDGFRRAKSDAMEQAQNECYYNRFIEMLRHIRWLSRNRCW